MTRAEHVELALFEWTRTKHTCTYIYLELHLWFIFPNSFVYCCCCRSLVSLCCSWHKLFQSIYNTGGSRMSVVWAFAWLVTSVGGLGRRSWVSQIHYLVLVQHQSFIYHWHQTSFMINSLQCHTCSNDLDTIVPNTLHLYFCFAVSWKGRLLQPTGREE